MTSRFPLVFLMKAISSDSTPMRRAAFERTSSTRSSGAPEKHPLSSAVAVHSIMAAATGVASALTDAWLR